MTGAKKRLTVGVFLGLMQVTTLALAAPQVVLTDPATGQPLPNQPMTASNVTGTTSPLQNPNQPTLAQLNKPSDSALSQANNVLLAKNAELQREIDSIKNQNIVLVNERNGDLFVKGAYTAALSMLAGLGLGWLVFGRNKRW